MLVPRDRRAGLRKNPASVLFRFWKLFLLCKTRSTIRDNFPHLWSIPAGGSLVYKQSVTKFLATMLSVAITVFSVAPAWADTCSVGLPTQQLTPLTDFQPGQLYKGFAGLLYDESNTAPDDHIADGQSFASHIVPRNTSGQPDSVNGKIVFVSLGFSNNTIEFCGGGAFFENNSQDDPRATDCPLPFRPPVPLKPISPPCTPLVDCPYNQAESFMGKAFNENRNPPHDGKIVLVDGAKGGITLDMWDPTTDTECGSNPCFAQYDRVLQILNSAGLTQAQVQGIWFKSADADPTISLPSQNADAYVAERHLGNIMRAIRTRYPNARQVFISPRIYGGFANVAGNSLNKEPFAYELGFSIKWLINAQIQEIRDQNYSDPIAGNLRYQVQSGNPPSTWIDWGPYLWSDGHNCKPGFACINTDFRGTGNAGPNECTHPSTFGEDKVGTQLLNFVNNSVYTNWFRVH